MNASRGWLWVLFLASVAYYLWKSAERRRLSLSRDGRERVPPPAVPSHLPFGLDLLYQLASNYDHVFELLMEQRKITQSNTYQTTMLNQVGIITLDPENVKHFLAKNWTNYEKSDKFQQVFNPLLGNGIFNSNGQTWKFHRTEARPHFQRMELNAMVPVFTNHCGFLLRHFERQPPTATVDVQKLFFSLTLDSATEILFGHNVDSLNDPNCQFGPAFDTLQSLTAYRSTLYSAWKLGLMQSKKFDDSLVYLNKFVDDIVDKCYRDKASGRLDEREDLLAQYVRAAADGNTTIDREYLRNMLKNMLIAGRDTTACLLTWTFFELAQHPDIEARVVAEIAECVGMENTQPSGSQLQELKYLKRVLNEVLRLHPSVPLDLRTAVEEDWLPNGMYVAKGADLIYSAYLTHRLPEYWGADADKFDPDRFTQERFKSVPPFAFVPFHGGPRICLGQNMAYEEAKLAIVLILQKFRLRLAVPAETIDYRNIIILQAKNGMPMHILPAPAVE